MFIDIFIEGNLEIRPLISIKIPDSISLSLGILRKYHNSNEKKKICAKMVTVALFTIAQSGSKYKVL